MLQLQKKGTSLQQVSSNFNEGVKKLVLVLTTFMLVIITRKKAFKTAETTEAVETAGASEDGKDGKGGKYSGNLA